MTPHDTQKPGVRPAEPSDLDAITSIYADAVTNGAASYELEPPSRLEMAARYEALTAAGFPYLVAEDADRVLGYAYAGPFRTRPAYRFIVENSVYVAPDAKARGVGRLLLGKLVAEATRLGFRQMVAVIGDGHPASPSVRLHERLGFRHCGRLEGSGYKHGRWLDTTLMQLSMNGGRETPPDTDAMAERTFRGKAK
ncbi:MAG: GNAT family N-acetyltransferase [Hyphomicrobiales bacterium]|nr:GNAT family N-acetyltransferase [Hyphomicrobiales bacterium]